MSPLGHVCPGLALHTQAPAGGEPEGFPGFKQSGLRTGRLVCMRAAFRVSQPR